MKEFEQVKYKKLNGPVPKGSKGTIVYVYEKHDRTYEVEFFDSNHKTIGVYTVEESEIYVPSTSSIVKKHYPFVLGLILCVCIAGYPLFRQAPSVFLLFMYLVGYFKLTKFHE